jgi:hypothetical protein
VLEQPSDLREVALAGRTDQACVSGLHEGEPTEPLGFANMCSDSSKPVATLSTTALCQRERLGR